MAVISLASLIGGNISHQIGRALGHLQFFIRIFDRARPTLEPMLERYGIWAIAVASLTPLPFSTSKPPGNGIQVLAHQSRLGNVIIQRRA